MPLADMMSRLAGIARAKGVRVHLPGVEAARDLLIGRGMAHVSMGELEAASGLNRWELARHFRAAYGVSPHRFHLLRRLGVARGMLMQSGPLADIALSCGFADQAHLTRHFKSAFGLSPGRWRVVRSEGLTCRAGCQADAMYRECAGSNGSVWS